MTPLARASATALLALAALAPARSAAGEPAPGRPLDWARDAVFYEVFVRSFADADGDGVGDLAGLTARLDYLNDGDPAAGSDLGVDALWLMPVFESPSYHGYDVVDYERIDAEYGSLADFERLLAEAHRRGMRVIVDLVMNHTSDQHPWFVDAARGPGGAKRDWYVWRGSDPGWTQPWGGSNPTWHARDGAFYYGIFWGGMPDLNFANPEVRAEMKRIARLWLARGVDGFRLDATRHLFADGPGDLQNDRPATHDFLRELVADVRAARPDALLVGENWTDSDRIAPYFGAARSDGTTDELPMSFDFPMAGAIVEAVRSGDGAPVRRVLADVEALYPAGALDAPFLTNHDQDRVATQLGDERDRLGLAAAVLLTLPGAPFLYYGEEIGLANGGQRGDPGKRTPMPWDADGRGFSAHDPWSPFAPGRDQVNVAAEDADPASLLARYRSWIRLRAAEPALRRGALRQVVPESADGALLAWLRAGAGRPLLVVHNLGGKPLKARLVLAPPAALTRVAGDGTAAADGNRVRVALPPRSSAVFALE